MHRVFRDVEQVNLSFQAGNLWIQLSFTGGERQDINIFGNGRFTIFGKTGSKLKQEDNVTVRIENPKKVIYFKQDIPPLTTVKIFDESNTLLYHLITEEDIDIR